MPRVNKSPPIELPQPRLLGPRLEQSASVEQSNTVIFFSTYFIIFDNLIIDAQINKHKHLLFTSQLTS